MLDILMLEYYFNFFSIILHQNFEGFDVYILIPFRRLCIGVYIYYKVFVCTVRPLVENC